MGTWQDINTAPKDRRILGWIDHSADPYHQDNNLTPYGAWAECTSHAEDGVAIIEWGGGYHDTNAPEGPEEWMPDWWFISEPDEFDVVANPTHWMPLPEAPSTPTDHASHGGGGR